MDIFIFVWLLLRCRPLSNFILDLDLVTDCIQFIAIFYLFDHFIFYPLFILEQNLD